METNLFRFNPKIERTNSGRLKLALLLILLFVFLVNPVDMLGEGIEHSNQVQSDQQIKVSGTVTTSADGTPLPGVNVAVKGTNVGVITDQNGQYAIAVDKSNAVLVFSFIGYQTQEVTINERTIINVVLNESATMLEELVVVGYATQRKINQTGSVATVNSNDLKQAPVSNVVQSMMGRLPGLVSKNITGQPGDINAVKFSVRGFGTPLIIIDGMPASSERFVQLDANDLENVTILKDAASAAVYGARAGNGVILVTTKRGTEMKPVFNYTGNYGWQSFINPPDFASSYQVKIMENIALLNEEKPPLNTDEVIQKYKDGTDPAYPNTDWFEETFAKYSPQTQHNLSVQGGSESVKYFISGGYLSQDGQYKSGDLNYQRVTLRSNIDVALTKKFTIGLDLNLLSSMVKSPPYGAGRTDDVQGIYHAILRSQPTYPAEFPDKTKISYMGYFNPVAMSNSDISGYKNTNKVFGDVIINLAYELPWGFKVKGVFNYNRTYERIKERRKEFQVYTYDWATGVYTFRQNNTFSRGGDAKSLTESFSLADNINQQYFLTWDKDFGKHKVSALAVYELLSSNWENISALRQSYDYNVDYLFAGPDLNKDNSGSAGEDGRAGLITRLNYVYDNRYLFEFNSRYDGSSRFPETSRWGFFPSVSGGWRISEESFFEPLLNYIDNAKIRASWGKSGYDNVGQYKYLSLYSIPSTRFIYDQTLERGITSDAIANPDITWEKMTTRNLGLDFGILSNKLRVEFDWFYRKRTDVLGTRSASTPSVVGAVMPSVNYASYDNRGFELVLTYSEARNDFFYNVSGNITWTRERTLQVDQPLYANDEERRRNELVGQWTNRLWGYQALGLFQTEEEIDLWADQDGKNNATILPGDIKYEDINGDGKIDAADQTIIGRGSTPEIMYGLSINASWKGIDIGMLWQGATNFNYNLLLIQETYRPFYAASPMWDFWYTDAYTPENPWIPANLDGYYPRYRTDNNSRTHSNWNRVSTYWLADATYLRLKTFEIGYTLPGRFTKKVGVGKFRIFVNANNLLTFSSLKILDPEIEVDRTVVPYPGMYYPQTKITNAGISITF